MRLSRLALATLFIVGCHHTTQDDARAPQVAPSAVVPRATATASSAPPVATFGELQFTVTGTPDCQRLFQEGMLAMHSFLYDQAHDKFAAALAADPTCAMAAWGDAMSYDHPIWSERDVVKARAALARAVESPSLTPKERAYLATAKELYARDDVRASHAAWLSAAAKMHSDYADDDEVTLQHALALLAVYGYDPKHMRGQMEAGALALDVLRRKPTHPGAAHYAIHAFDSPDHAILALPAARTYASIAPSAGHALHMPSHTFTHLGMWRDVVPSNERAYAASVAWEKSRGSTPSKYDWHSYSWLVAAHLELGQAKRARELIDEARALLVAATDDSADFRLDYAHMIASYVTHTERWSDAEGLSAPVLTPVPNEGKAGSGPVACAAHAPGGGADVRLPTALMARTFVHELRIEAALSLGDKDAVEKRVADLRAVRSQMAAWAPMIPADGKARAEARIEAYVARAHAMGKAPNDARKKAKEAASRVAHLERDYALSGPAWLKTANEKFGEEAVLAGDLSEALASFEADIALRPNRSIALLCAARAARALGQTEKAKAYFTTLADLWSNADDSPAVAEARAGAK